jgi:hydrogenase/urease accessory protein HupE
VLAALVVLVACTCHAHAVGVSRGDYRRVSDGLEVRLVFSRSELTGLGDETRVVQGIEVRTGVAATTASTPCRAEATSSRALENDGLELDARFRCPNASGPLTLSLAPLLSELSRGHRHQATLLPNGASELLFEGHARLVVPAVAETAPEAATSSLLGFIRLGVEHILTGYDHLIFLLGLVVVGLGTRRTLVVATAFTLAHSLSLAASVLGVWTPPSSLVEPAIALSIAYVGIENLVSERHERRAWLAFGFGLIHGFGFASALSGVRFQGLELARALLGFNTGVELGQLLVLGLLLPLVALLTARPAWARPAVRGTSVAVALAGMLWFVSRVAGS